MRKPPTMTGEARGSSTRARIWRSREAHAPRRLDDVAGPPRGCPHRWPRGWAGWPAAPWPGRWAGSAAPAPGRSPATGASAEHDRQEHDHDRVGGHGPADVGEVDAEQLRGGRCARCRGPAAGRARPPTATARAHRRRCSRSRVAGCRSRPASLARRPGTPRSASMRQALVACGRVPRASAAARGRAAARRRRRRARPSRRPRGRSSCRSRSAGPR